MLKECVVEASTIEEALQKAAAELDQPVDALQYDVLQEPQKKTFGLFGGCNAKIRAYVEEEETPASPYDAAQKYLYTLLTNMGLADPVITMKEEEGGCTLTVEGDNLGFIIGHRGDTLDALQYLTGLVANRVENSYYRVTLDIGNYRQKREQALSGLARKIGNQAARTGRKTSLEPMNRYGFQW